MISEIPIEHVLNKDHLLSKEISTQSEPLLLSTTREDLAQSFIDEAVAQGQSREEAQKLVDGIEFSIDRNVDFATRFQRVEWDHLKLVLICLRNTFHRHLVNL